jgi:hypothetical protein
MFRPGASLLGTQIPDLAAKHKVCKRCLPALNNMVDITPSRGIESPRYRLPALFAFGCGCAFASLLP